MTTTPIDKLLEECEELSFNKDSEGVLEISDKILKIDATNFKAMSYRAMALYYLGEYAESLKCINRILELNFNDKYYSYFKIKVLIKLKRTIEAYDVYKSLNDDDPHKEVLEDLAHSLIDIKLYGPALECLDKLNEKNWLFNFRIVDGFKRIENHADLNLKDRYDGQFYMKWIDMIKAKSDEETCPICGGTDFNNQFNLCDECGEEIQMGSEGTLIECDSLKVYYYICDKLHALKEFFKEYAYLGTLHERMDCLDDAEFGYFIEHLQDIGYAVEASKGYIFDGDLMKPFCDKGMHAAPRWLVFPEFTPGTIGWRMGAGEEYRLNEPPRGEEFARLFPRPKNWMFNPWGPKFQNIGKMPYISTPWDGEFTPKYTLLGDDAVKVNDFITPSQEGEFRIDAYHFCSIEHAILFSKILSYNKDIDSFEVTFEELKNDYDISDDDQAQWEYFKYAVCLNATYYRIMQDKNLKQKLLATGNRPLVYVSDDEWGGEENLFGFALMQVRDEVRRLCENENLIDWKYSEYLKHADLYLNRKRDSNDEQSAEYKVASSVFANSSRYVRDTNLDEKLAEKYEIGQILTERAFVDASSRIGGMVTSHRYLILSQFMADLSRFEEKTNWGIHVAKNGSRFKVLDIFEHDGKTQILLLQLPDGFDGVFEKRTNIEEEFIRRERENFKDDLKKDVIDDLKDEIWLERVSFPIGMSDEGEFY